MEKTQKPALLLLPNLLGDHRHHELFLPASVDKAVSTLDGLIAESMTGGLRYLGRFQTKKPPNQTPIALLNEHTPDADLDFLLEPITKNGERWGVVSDCGLPCIADPGAKLVSRARQLGIVLQAFSGPSSIMLALMLSGLSGQHFTFHGYIDKESQACQKTILNMEKMAKDGYTQLFIEAPYRNQRTLEMLLATLSEQTHLCVAWDLTLPTQGMVSQPVALWKKSPLPNLDKKPAIFIVGKS